MSAQPKKKASKQKAKKEAVEEDEEEESGGGLAGLLGDYGSDSEGEGATEKKETKSKEEPPARPKPTLPSAADLLG